MNRWKKICCLVCGLLLLAGCTGTFAPPVATPAATAEPVAAPALAVGDALVGPSAQWRYLADGSEPSPGDSAAWRETGFDDSLWLSGSGSLGAKDGELAALGSYLPGTLLPMRDADGQRIPAYFFRTTFRVENPAEVPALMGTLLYDDAVIVYINGVRVFEGNVPEDGFESALSYGAKSAQDEPREGAFRAAAGMLQQGDNTLCVELHQAAESSTDIYFEFSSLLVTENVGTLSVDGLCLFTAGDDAVTARWFHDGTDMTLCYAAAGADDVIRLTADCEETPYGYRYSVALTALATDTEYRFTVESAIGRTEERRFQTAAEDGVTFLLVGDPQITGHTSANALTHALTLLPDADFALYAGDLTNSSKDEEEYRLFLDAAGGASLPAAAVLGNHEGPALYDVFFAPEGVTASGRDFRFSYGDTLFVCLDSNSDDMALHEAFLRDSIAAGSWDFVIVCMHHSLFSMGKHADATDTETRREAYAPMFSAYDVDLVLSGHDHIYARTKLMENCAPVDGGQADKLSKARGQTLYVSAGSSTGSKYYEREDVDMAPFAAVSEQERPTITRIEVGRESIHIFTCYADDGTRVDDVTLLRMSERRTGFSGWAAGARAGADRASLLASETDYLLSTQLDNGAFATYPVAEGENAVNPYFADYSAMALLQTGETDAVKRYLDWRFRHLNTAEFDINGLAYTAYDYTVTVQDGRVSAEAATMSYDSTDSYAATLLLLLSEYYAATGDAAYIRAQYPQFAGVAQVLLTTAEVGLTVARPDYRVQYLMDNCEVSYALRAADALLFDALLPGLSGAEAESGSALRASLHALSDTIACEIERRLWNEGESRYAVAAQPDGYIAPFDQTRFYPDAVAQLSPIIYGQLDAKSDRAKRLYGRFCEDWDWMSFAHLDTGATSQYWGMVAYCAAVMGDTTRLSAFLDTYAERCAIEHAYPLFNADAAWVILACTYGGAD